MAEAALAPLAELKLPARHEFRGLARRLVIWLATQSGFDPEGAEELAMAVAQACGNVVEAARAAWGAGATLRLAVTSTERGLSLDVDALAPGSREALPIRSGQPESPVPGAAATQMASGVLWDVIRALVDVLDCPAPGGGEQLHFRLTKYLVQPPEGES
jgi:anti-sigma regulatory factor (Ser/Thr protein kinase)